MQPPSDALQIAALEAARQMLLNGVKGSQREREFHADVLQFVIERIERAQSRRVVSNDAAKGAA